MDGIVFDDEKFVSPVELVPQFYMSDTPYGRDVNFMCLNNGIVMGLWQGLFSCLCYMVSLKVKKISFL